MRLLEDFDDNGFIYERGSIVLKGYFFQETHQIDSHVHFQATSQMSQVVNIVIWHVQHA